jgi:hypothetical protein
MVNSKEEYKRALKRAKQRYDNTLKPYKETFKKRNRQAFVSLIFKTEVSPASINERSIRAQRKLAEVKKQAKKVYDKDVASAKVIYQRRK